MLHLNDLCPVCGQTFTESDDIVFCPDCGTPHHRACWNQHGACAHADKHDSGYVWQSAAPPVEESAHAQETIRCPRCGETCAANTLVCPECGQRMGEIPGGGRYDYNADFFMRGVEADAGEDLGDVTVREASMLVQYRAGVYVRKFDRLKSKKFGWNWAAFFFSPFWFFYRKIYKAGALFMGVMLALSVFMAIPLSKVQDETMSAITEFISIDETTTPEEIMAALAALQEPQKQKVQAAVLRYSKWMLLYFAVLFVPNFAAAAAADAIYKKKIVRGVQSMRAFSQNEQTFRLLALRRGGVSVLGILCSFMLANLFFNAIFLYL